MEKPTPPKASDYGGGDLTSLSDPTNTFKGLTSIGMDRFWMFWKLSLGFITLLIIAAGRYQLPSSLLDALVALPFLLVGGFMLALYAALIALALIHLTALLMRVGLMLQQAASARGLLDYLRYLRALSVYKRRLREYEDWERRVAIDFWTSLGGYALEAEVGKLFSSLGYRVEFTPPTGDGGVDLILTRDNKKSVVQCKAHAKKVSVGTARELFAARSNFGADEAILVSTSGVTKPTWDYCIEHGIRVLNAQQLATMQRTRGLAAAGSKGR